MKQRNIWDPIVLISALGYFVDIFDLVLFSIVRVPSLRALGVVDSDLLSKGMLLLNLQMTGMLLGGIFWGILGDKFGRVKVLFGSILMYSFANILNSFVTNVETYAVLRFFAGLGLAGELGAAITLVCEVLPTQKRGLGTMLVATFGVMGGMVASLCAQYFSWKATYILGGILGICLLILRFKVLESKMFQHISHQNISKGNIFLLLKNKKLRSKYIYAILAGSPIWLIAGILITFSPEIAKAMHVQGDVVASKGIMSSYFGAVIGDCASGVWSQILRSRKKAMMGFVAFTFVTAAVYLNLYGLSAEVFYFLCVLLGIGGGYWAVFVTAASESFGTNLRATVTTSVPNFVRALVLPLSFSVQFLTQFFPLNYAIFIVTCVACALAAFSIHKTVESFEKDLDYVENFS